MYSNLSPGIAWNLASEAYIVRDTDEKDFRKIFSPTGVSPLRNIIDVEGLEVLSGNSGWFGSSSNFGFIAPIKNRPSEFVLATRGTASMADACTDVSAALKQGPDGHSVHAGFHNVWESYSSQLSRYLAKRRVGRIHCVGHSLGGALANLNAGYLAKSINVNLYTFGEPRVGLRGYSEYLSSLIPVENVFRVRHELDVVSMVPCFGFMHAPYVNDSIVLTSGFHPLVYSSHLMADGYKESSSLDISWSSLKTKSKARKDYLTQSMALWQENDQFYLEQLSAFPGGYMSGRLLILINAAIDSIFKRMGTCSLISVENYSSGNFTVLDQLCEMIYRFGQTSVEASKSVISILKSMLHFIGKVASLVVDAAITTLRWVVGQFIGVLTQIASRAFSLVG